MNTTLQTIHTAHTTHGNFDDREVSVENLQIILNAAVRAATASNRQAYSIIVVRDRQIMRQLCGYSGSSGLLFCVDFNRIHALAEHLGYETGKCNLTDFVTGSIDTALAAQNAVIAAQSLGIDSQITNGIHRGDIRRVYQLMNLPDQNCFPLLMLILGYADQQPEHLKGRLKGTGVIHYDQYKTLDGMDLDEITAVYDDANGHLAMNPSWHDEGFAHYLDWFHRVWASRFKPLPEGIPDMQQIFTSSGFLHPLS